MPYTRLACAPLRGFHYQLLVSILHILQAEDNDEIMVEGIVEDIDISTPNKYQAIQCKYSESNRSFTLSQIYKPVLLMMVHYSVCGCDKFEYILYIHNRTGEIKSTLTLEDIDEILNSKNGGYKAYIDKIPHNFSRDGFLRKFRICNGKSLCEMEIDVKEALGKNNLRVEYIDELYYPNAVHFIGELSRHDKPQERNTTKAKLIKFLEETHSTLFSKWTVIATTKDTALRNIQKQLCESLKCNTRERAIIIGTTRVSVWNDAVDLVISFVGKYAFKKKLHEYAPIFYIDTDFQKYQMFLDSLSKLREDVFTCEIGTRFDEYRANQKSTYIKERGTRDFYFKVARLNQAAKEHLNSTRINDLFIFSSLCHIKGVEGVQIYKYEQLEANEVKFVLGVRKTYV